MERVAFVIEKSGERISAMLNPETMVVRRLAGVRPRMSGGGILSGRNLSDDPLLFTGGGLTELTLDLLFDLNVAGSTVESTDVRDLTKPFQSMAENVPGEDGLAQPPLVTFVWGKAWNITGVVTAVAERLEFFSAEGAAQRSRLRMRLVRTPEPIPAEEVHEPLAPLADFDPPAELAGDDTPETGPAGRDSEPASTQESYQIIGGGSGEEEDSDSEAADAPPPQSGDRLDQVAHRFFGDPSKWRLLAIFNRIADPLKLAAGQVLRIPDRLRQKGAQ